MTRGVHNYSRADPLILEPGGDIIGLTRLSLVISIIDITRVWPGGPESSQEYGHVCRGLPLT